MPRRQRSWSRVFHPVCMERYQLRLLEETQFRVHELSTAAYIQFPCLGLKISDVPKKNQKGKRTSWLVWEIISIGIEHFSCSFSFLTDGLWAIGPIVYNWCFKENSASISSSAHMAYVLKHSQTSFKITNTKILLFKKEFIAISSNLPL